MLGEPVSLIQLKLHYLPPPNPCQRSFHEGPGAAQTPKISLTLCSCAPLFIVAITNAYPKYKAPRASMYLLS